MNVGQFLVLFIQFHILGIICYAVRSSLGTSNRITYPLMPLHSSVYLISCVSISRPPYITRIIVTTAFSSFGI